MSFQFSLSEFDFDFSNYTDDNYTNGIDLSFSPCTSSDIGLDSRLVVVIYTLVVLLGLLGNILVIFVILCMDNKRSSTDVYLLNLAVADLLFALTLPFWAVYVNTQWIFGVFMCKLVSVMQEANFYSGILLLACISVDRYLAIVHATHAITQKRHLVHVVCAGVWVVAVLLSLPILINRTSFWSSSHKKFICHDHLEGESVDRWRVTIRFMRHIVGFFIPLAIMIFCYGFTVKTLCQTRSGQKHRAMKVIFAVVLAFVFCWFPNNLAVFVDTLMRSKVIEETCEVRNQVDTALDTTQILAFMHCCINPLMYAFIGQKFRNSFLKALLKHGFISKKAMAAYRRGSSHYSTSGNTSTTL
ncbi:C-X-C chemokine receptor type 2 isoform X2 [Amia ocellicauda]